MYEFLRIFESSYEKALGVKEMNKYLKKIIIYLNYWRTVPAYLIAKGGNFWDRCKRDISEFDRHLYGGGTVNLFTFSRILVEELCSRNVVENRLHRNPIRCLLFRVLFKQMESLYINTPPERIEGGLSFQHGFSTVVAAKHIGQDCRIFQQVTIGFNGMEQPVLEDRVEVSAGAIVIGNVCLHSDCVVGAGAVVVNDVNENTVVVGVPAKTIRFNRE